MFIKCSKTIESYEKSEKQWTEQDMKDALHYYHSTPGATIQGIVNRFGIYKLQFRLKRNPDEQLRKAGRKCVFDEETELASVLPQYVITGLVHRWKNFE